MLVGEVFGKVLRVSDGTLKRWWHKTQAHLLDMRLLPEQERILVLPYSAEEVAYRLQGMTKPRFEERHKQDYIDYEFHGKVTPDSFKLSPTLKYPDNFVPIIEGQVEKTSRGSLVFVSYKLYNSTKAYLVACLCLSLFIAAGFVFWKPNLWFATAAVLFFGLNYWACFASFNRHKRQCHKLIWNTLN